MTDTLKCALVYIDGKYRCLYINDYRVHGGKPYTDENQNIFYFNMKMKDLENALGFTFPKTKKSPPAKRLYDGRENQ